MGYSCYVALQYKSLLNHLLDELNACGQVETEVNECPLNALALVLLLLEHKHVMVEELLQLLVDEVDPKLLEGVKLKEITSHLLTNAVF